MGRCPDECRQAQRIRTCVTCDTSFQVAYPSTVRATCSKACKGRLQADITHAQFADPAHRVKHAEATAQAIAKVDMKAVVARRRSYKGSGHPLYGKPCSDQRRERIAAANTGKRLGISWETTLGPELAAARRAQNSEYMCKTNEKLMYNKTSALEKAVYAHLAPFGYRTNVKVGRYVVDIVKENCILEIFGDYWHCNPAIYASDFYNKSVKKTAQELWAKDAQRVAYLQKRGFTVYVLWERDLKRDGVAATLHNLGLDEPDRTASADTAND